MYIYIVIYVYIYIYIHIFVVIYSTYECYPLVNVYSLLLNMAISFDGLPNMVIFHGDVGLPNRVLIRDIFGIFTT